MIVDEMPAGRAMDALVAEKVMMLDGFRKGTPLYDGRPFPGWEYVFEAWDGAQPIPQYSTKIAAAWEVVEKMRQINEHWCPSIHWDDGDGIADGCWVCTFSFYGVSQKDFRQCLGFAPVLPLAICRTALKAVGIEEV